MTEREVFRQILSEHDPYDADNMIVCGCGRRFEPGKAVHLGGWSRHVADLLLDAMGDAPCGSR